MTNHTGNLISGQRVSQSSLHLRLLRLARPKPLIAAVGVGGLLILLTLTTLASASSPTVAAQSGDPVFGLPAYLPGSGNATLSVAVGDLNGDGALDLVLGNLGQPSQVYMNDGRGNFAAPVSLPGSGNFTLSVAVGDLNGDGTLDLVLGNQDQPSQVYLNDGNGNFAAPVSLPGSGNFTLSVAVGDLNGDGALDLVLGNQDQPSQVYLNDGRANFTVPIPLPGSDNSKGRVVMGDLDGNGALDLVLGNGYQFSLVYLNDRRGNFAVPVPLPGSGNGTVSVAVGDLNGDGALDLVLGNLGQPSQVFLNDGLANFGVPTSLPVSGNRTLSVAVGDLNGDGALDLVLGDERQSSQVYVNDGRGNFAVPVPLPDSGNGTLSVAVGDLNGDGALDLILGNQNQPSQVYVNHRRGNFAAPVTLPGSGNDTWDVAVGDLNGDGALDLMLGNFAQPSQVFLNDGQGNFAESISLPGSGSDTLSVAVGDLNGDGALDLVLGNQDQSSQVYLNDGQGNFAVPVPLPNSGNSTLSLAVGDLNGDGALDLVLGNFVRPSQIYLNDGRGNFAAPLTLPGSGNRTFGVAVGDLNGDGALDLVLGNFAPPSQVYVNDGQGNFTMSIPLPSNGTRSVAMGDLNGDGALDLILGNLDQPSRIYMNDGQGNFAMPTPLPGSNTSTESIAVGDLNGDGALDLILGNGFQPSQVYINDGQGNFAAPLALPGRSNSTNSVAVGDLNGDGALDLVLGEINFANSKVPSQVYLNRSVVTTHLSNNPPSVAVTRPGSTHNANFFSTPQIINSSTIPISYSLFDTEGDTVGRIVAYYSLNGGGRWQSAIATSGTLTANLATGRMVRTSRAYSPTQAIPDGPTGILSVTLPISGAETIADLDVSLSISHTRDSDLQVALISPAGTRVPLFSGVGGNDAGFLGTVLDDQAATPIISGTAPFAGTYRPQGSLALFNGQTLSGTWQLVITDTVAGERGSLTGWGLRIATPRAAHIYYWDTVASGIFGQSDNVIFRLEAYPQPSQNSITGTYRYPNATAGPYQRPYAAATTFPFRVRGTQVRVVHEAGQPVQGALVYRLPGGEPMGGSTAPFRTTTQGYLQGRGELNLGDQLVALWPVSRTEKYTLYHTSATPIPTGLAAFTVTQAGVQTLTVSAAYPLLLFNLDVSLQWDASNDPGFVTQLEQNLAKTSAALYDWTNGQVALGRVTVYQDKQRRDEADVRIFASNQIRPIANRGGIVTQTTVLSFTRPITFTSGEIRIGPTWNRYGDPQPIGDDWPNVLAHELGHYALFLEDTYLGLDESGILIPIDICADTAMSDPYSDGFSEFRYADGQWQQQCGQTLAEMPDWEMIAQAYPALRSPPPTNTGPSAMPFAFTQIELVAAPGHSQPLLDDFNIQLNDAGGALSTGRAYLRHPGERLVDLGQPVLNSVLARGAREGDELCVFGAAAFACSPLSNSVPTQLITHTLWRPEIILTPINSTTLQIFVNTATNGTLMTTVYPNGEAPQVTVLTPTIATTVTLIQPAVEVLVDIMGNGPGERIITGYATGAGPGQQRGHGGPGQQRGHGGPFASGDGSLIIYPPRSLRNDVFIVVQTATSLPELPPGLAAIGRAYHIRPSKVVTDFTGASVSFQYLGLDVLLADVSGTPQEKEASLAVEYWDGTTWTQLKTTLNPTQNFASAPLPGPGLYVLTAGRAMPAISSVSPASGESGQAHWLTLTGQNYLAPLLVTLTGQTGQRYPLSVTLVNSRTVMARTPVTLPVDLYDLELANAGGLMTTLGDAFALYAIQPEGCFFDNFASGWGKWTRTGEWDIVTTGGQEAATDSPGASYLNAEPGSTRTTTITSRGLNLPVGSDPILSFRHDYVIAKGPGHQDWGTVEISFDGGATWQLLARYSGGGGYPASLTTQDEWSQINWKTVTINLRQAGMPANATTAQVRFNLVVDALGSDKGWIVDDIAVRASGCPQSRAYVYLPLIAKQAP